MKFILSLLLVFPGVIAVSQTPLPIIKLKRGNFVPPQRVLENIDITSADFESAYFENAAYLFLQFKQIPSSAQKATMFQKGIELIEYIPENTYLVKVTGSVPKEVLTQFQVINTVTIFPQIKIDPFVERSIPEKQTSPDKELELLASGFPGISTGTMIAELMKRDINASEYKKGWEGAVKITIASNRIFELAKISFIYYIEELAGNEIPLTNESGAYHGTTILQNSQPGIGRGLSGKGVVMGMGDIGGAGHHIDHYYKTIEPWPSQVYHSSHVAGIMAGAGLIDPRMKGRAPESSLIVDQTSDIFFLTSQYYTRFGMLLTNNSYGGSAAGCRGFGGYNSTSKFIDQQLLDYPSIMHVFAAGNEITRTCAPFPTGYQTLFAGPQSAKNIITVGGSSKDDPTNYFSKGPAQDGRIKPEITALGRSVFSTVPVNAYFTNTGTSMACPQVTGSLALLIERYRQLNNGTNPPGALLKNIICNATADVGNTGPDFANGYGSLDALPAIEILEKKNYYSSSVQHTQQQTNSFAVGANASEIRVMLYWPDRPASLFATSTLVNDLDIIVTAPNGTIIKPLILNASPASVLNTAVSGEDHINNMEQVIIRNPVAGNYTITIKGYNVPFGPQLFFVSYHIIDKGLSLLSPLKKDKWKGGEKQVIKWIEPGENPINYLVEFSGDGGVSWQAMGTTTGNTKQLLVSVPQLITVNGRIRVTNTSTNQSVFSDSLVVLPEPVFTLVSTCDKMAEVRWPSVPGIDSFTVLLIDSGRMKDLVTTADTFFLIRNLSMDSVYWISIAPVKNGIKGERSIAKSIKPVGTGCTLSEFDGDIEVGSLVSPLNGRKNTSTERTASEKITIQLRNLDNDISAVPVVIKVYVNSILFEQDTITTAIAAYGSLLHTLKKSIDLSAAGVYSLQVIAEKAGDPIASNNILEKKIKILPNPSRLIPFEDNFELLKDTTYGYPGYFGLEGRDNWDYSSDNYTGGLKTRITPSQKVILPTKLPIRPLNVINTLTGTFNFSNYTNADNIFLSYNTFRNDLFGQWYVRGSDTSAWIAVQLFSFSSPPNIRRNITQILTSQGQKFSSSFQLRFDASKSSLPIDKPDTSSYLSNVQFQFVDNDLSIDLATSNGSSYFSNDTIVITSRTVNLTNKPASNVVLTVRSSFSAVTDTIAFVNAYDTITTKHRLITPRVNAFLADTITVSLAHSSDSYAANNDRKIAITVLPLLDTFPYFESFEGDDNFWTSNGGSFYDKKNQYKNRILLNGANGKGYWYTSNVGDNFPDSRVLLINSRGIDISKMKNPYLSFSTARYLRPGRDSAIVQIFNKGKAVFQRLNSVNSYNWYNFKNNTVWSDSNKVYWHSVTCKLPDTSSVILLRIITYKVDSFRTPAWLGSTAIDDIHIYSLDKIIADSITQSGSGTIVSSGSGWKEIDVNGKISAAINFNGQNPGTLNWQVIPSRGSNTILNGQKLLKNRWVFKTSSTLQKPVRMRLYFSDAEAEMLRTLNKCNGCIDTVSAYNFGIYQFSGTPGSVNSIKHDNIVSRYKAIDASAFDLIPYANGYYAEFETELTGEFYIQLPERFTNLGIQFTAKPLQNNTASVSWSVTDEKEIEKYIIEKAIGDDAFESGAFSSLYEQAAGNTLSYSYEDKLVDKTVRTYYRLKVIYKNGYIRYSGDQAVTLQGAGNITVFPNPSNGLYTISVPQTNGEEVVIQLMNSLGQVILSTQKEASGTLDEIKIDIRKSIYPPGTYFLKIKNGNEVKTFKLVKQ